MTEESAIVAGAGSGIGAATALPHAVDEVAVSRRPDHLLRNPESNALVNTLHVAAADLTIPEEVNGWERTNE